MSVIRSFLRYCVLQWRKEFQQFLWKRQAAQALASFCPKGQSIDASLHNNKKVLILCPHADDEWIGCSRIIINKNSDCHVLYYKMYGYNQTNENKAIRDEEIKQCAEKWDFRLLDSVQNTLEFLTISIQERRYDMFFIPSPIDWHWEHRDVFCDFVNAANRVGCLNDIGVFYYYISVPCVQSKNVYYAELTKLQQKSKWFYFEQSYRSQVMPVQRYKLQERIQHPSSSVFAAETYCRVSLDKLNFDKMRLSCNLFVQRLNSLKKIINNIYKVRKVVQLLDNITYVHERED